VSGRIVGEVLDNAPTDLTNAELLVLLAIAEDARDRDRLASYSDTESLVRRSRQKPGTVRNALSNLVARGLVTPVHDRVHRGGKHQEYKVTKLEPHHRNVSSHSDMNGSLHSDTFPTKHVTPR
jgi:predicted transcriptional regulator